MRVWKQLISSKSYEGDYVYSRALFCQFCVDSHLFPTVLILVNVIELQTMNSSTQ